MRLFILRLSGSCPTPLLGITYIFLLLYYCNLFFNVRSGYLLFRHSQNLIHNKLIVVSFIFRFVKQSYRSKECAEFREIRTWCKLSHMYRFSLFSIMGENIQS